MKHGFTDIHTHILPTVDDGAQSVEVALELLRLQKQHGIERVVLTPHFYPQIETLSDFVDRRNKAYTALLTQWEEGIMPQLLLGAEVHYSSALVDIELEQLTIGMGNYLLLELPDDEIPACLEQVVARILLKKITPIFAHVERCAFLRNDPDQLFKLIQMGSLAQIDVSALAQKKMDNFAAICLSNGLAQLIASDIHNLSNRALRLTDIATELCTDVLNRAEEFARAVWDGTSLPAFCINPVKKGLFRYH